MLQNANYAQQIRSTKSRSATRPKVKAEYYLVQHTVKKPVTCTGLGVHSGKPAALKISPSFANTGITFVRTDVAENNVIPARWDMVVDTSMCTKLGNAAGVTVSTVEHLLAALRFLAIHNAIIEIDGPEIPIMDGSSKEFINLIKAAGHKSLATPLPQIRVLKKIHVTNRGGEATLTPSDEPSIAMTFDASGRLAPNKWAFTFAPEKDDFASILADARTFGFLEDAKKLQAAGLARGASLENTIVINDDHSILNEDGLRHEDELIRHKLLDAYGDLYLAGGRLLGHFEGTNSGHDLNNKILHALFDDPDAWEYV